MKRKIPATMATQHPDNAMPTYWSGREFVNTYDEIEECYKMFDDLGVDEYMWDWEGKFVDESVVDKLFRDHYDYFKKNQIAREKFLTFRIPNIWNEKGYRLARAIMSILTAEDVAKDLKMDNAPIFEVILPMTTSHDQLMHIHHLFKKISLLKREIFDNKGDYLDHINVIPLIEEVDLMIDADKLIDKYITSAKKEGIDITDMRVFLARSDPSLNSGLIPAVLAVKCAISNLLKSQKKWGINIHPWLGAGSLPFRGGVNPDNYKAILDEYAGLSTITIQSAYRYDYPLNDVKKSIQYINKNIQKNRVNCIEILDSEIELIKEICKISTNFYQKTVEKIADDINFVASKFPSRRERVLHVGLFGYSRGIGKVKLPRAIKFTGSLYSLGVPPEIIGMGRSLKELKKRNLLNVLFKHYKYIKADMERACHYLNMENLEMLSKENDGWRDIYEDIKFIADILDIEVGPVDTHHFIHRNLVSTVYHRLRNGEDFSHELIEAGKVRKSLG